MRWDKRLRRAICGFATRYNSQFLDCEFRYISLRDIRYNAVLTALRNIIIGEITMIKLIIKKSIKDYQNTENEKVREA